MVHSSFVVYTLTEGDEIVIVTWVSSCAWSKRFEGSELVSTLVCARNSDFHLYTTRAQCGYRRTQVVSARLVEHHFENHITSHGMLRIIYQRLYIAEVAIVIGGGTGIERYHIITCTNGEFKVIACARCEILV
jgi:hypothetical protein